MPIDPKKIEEWKELVRISTLPWGSTRTRDGHAIAPGDIWNETDWFEGCSEALPLLLAEREEMLALLREVEWQGDYQGVSICPSCHAMYTSAGHISGCRLDALLRGAGAKK